MEIKNCKMCNHLFNSIGGLVICPSCNNQLEEKFKNIKDYIKNNENVTINIISDEFKVPKQQIKKWIKEERLTFANNSIGGIECESCGTLIKTGRYCINCKNKLIQEMNPIINTSKNKEIQKTRNNKMRFLNKDS